MTASKPHDATGLHPTARRAEKRADIEFAQKDTGLRKDVHDLGAMVGDLLREQGGEALYRVVEIARRTSINRREGDSVAGEGLDKLIGSLSVSMARDFIRAFSTYFQLVNTAEQVHRIRRRRAYLKDSSTRQPGSIQECVHIMREVGLGVADVRSLLGTLCIEPVFTAHPTEPTRRTILRKQQNIVRRLVEVQNPALTPHELEACHESIRTDITTIWQTEETPHEERTVFDELEHVLFYLTDVIYRALPPFYESLERALSDAYGPVAKDLDTPTIIRFASWIGGDMDARPEITARTIRETLARQRSLILNLYYHECGMLSEKLSQSTSRIGVSREIVERIDYYSQNFPNVAGQVPVRHRDMPYRRFMHLVRARLQSTYDDDVFPYETAEDFIGDIRLIARSLDDNQGRNAGLFLVRRLIRRAETFGFHLLTMDVRQDSMMNRSVVGRCLGEEGWMQQSADYRTARIRKALESNESPAVEPDNQSRRALAVFQSISYCRRKYGDIAIGPYVVSMTHGVDDILSVLLLARWGDLGRKSGAVPLDIAPFFETVEDLNGCAGQMDRLFGDAIYREHLKRRGNRQTVMVSYSDSNKDAGLASARWTLQQAQSALVDTLEKAGIELTMFHGRGGTISRGGGKTHAAVLGSPPGAVRGRLRATEQGELVNAKYGVRGIAVRTLEQAVGSVALASALPRRKQAKEAEEWPAIMDGLTTVARERYQALVYDTEGFYDYFRLATPVDVIERMQISRPGETAMVEGADNVQRHSPWDFAWTQSRHMLPGWYGLGSALARAIDEHGLEKIIEMAKSWHFFHALLSDVETVLAKSDLNIAKRYSALAGDLNARLFPVLRAEFDLSVEKVLKIRNQQVLLEKSNTLRRSIRLRNPYVDPMSLLQVELLQRWRESKRDDEELFAALVASVNGIARGLQDSG